VATNVNIPRRAQLVDQFIVTLPKQCGDHAGQPVRYTYHQVPDGYADAGKVIITFKVGGLNYRNENTDVFGYDSNGVPLKGSWQFTGRRLAEAKARWQDCIDQFVVAGAEFVDTPGGRE